ncbi:MAG TPA: acyl-CoA thioesterase domain-containing protein [Pseudonocardia sp.]|jgi:hypothetical protein|nr:acyl-CoA thioesterase domain-containing protein [Pseudonocardia sp.]
MNSGYFQLTGPSAETPSAQTLIPDRSAASLWGGDGNHLRGMAVSGVLARAVEYRATEDHPGLRPVRWQLDLFRTPTMTPCVASTTVVRAGRRLCLIDAVLQQDGRVIARAGALFLAESDPTEGKIWARPLDLPLPPADMRPATTESRLYFSEIAGWTPTPEPHQNDQRKQVWIDPYPVVQGEEPSAFQLAATAADAVNLVTSWGDRGLEYINADVNLVMGRLPVGSGIGLAAEHRVADSGIAGGSAVMFDREGPFGVVTASTLASPFEPIDPRNFGRAR